MRNRGRGVGARPWGSIARDLHLVVALGCGSSVGPASNPGVTAVTADSSFVSGHSLDAGIRSGEGVVAHTPSTAPAPEGAFHAPRRRCTPATETTTAAAPVTMTVGVGQPGHAIPETLYGAFFEEINHGGEGGLYAELIRNRAFNAQPSATGAPSENPWTLVTSTGAAGSMRLDTTQPLNRVLAQSLKLTVSKVSAGQRVGIANSGYSGIAVTPGLSYTASLYAKAAPGFAGPLAVTLEGASGVLLAQATLRGLTPSWQKFTVVLGPSNLALVTTNNRLVVSASSVGTVWVDMVSLFPPTWKGRPNGLRTDVASLLAASAPRSLRFPGGNYLEGNDVNTYFKWKNTIGDVAERPGHFNSWGYWVSDGLGIDEFFQLCEDLQAEPVLAIFDGFFLNTPVAKANMAAYVADAVDEVEYAIGDASTPWGGKRVANGHAAPYKLTYVEIGNEDDLGGGAASYVGYRFPMIYDAIKARFPAIKVIATAHGTTRLPDLVDEHYYLSVRDMIKLSHQYDATNRTGPKMMVGEYAMNSGGVSTLNAAISEAAAMTGFERNSDVVSLLSYAPLLVNDANRDWAPDLIVFNSTTVYGTPSYYVQKMFATHVGDSYLPTAVSGDDSGLYVTASLKQSDRTVFVKVANTSATARATAITLGGTTCAAPTVEAWVLTSAALSDTNSFANPTKVSPVESTVSNGGASFSFNFPANSVTVLTLRDVH
jgi:alpha-L-arabinofuranosidase